MALSFRGGIHPEEYKITAHCPIERVQARESVAIPLQQHLGKSALCRVKVGDHVCKGQTIAVADEGLSCPIHASVSGTVKAITTIPVPTGEGEAIVIENDFREEWSEEVRPFEKPLVRTPAEQLVAHIKSKGIVGMGGASFPTWQKVQSAVGRCETLIVNCAECEPYLTANHRLLKEHHDQVVGGMRILLHATGAQRAIFALEENKADVAPLLQACIEELPSVEVTLLKTKYPQGDERQLVRALLKKEIPQGKLPLHLGVVVFNAETCWEVWRAFAEGIPEMERIVTVSGSCVRRPSNLLVPIGMSLAELFDRCGGFSQKPEKILCGGPMMGHAQWTLTAPVTKAVSGVLALAEEKKPTAPCIHCGSCVRGCPMQLMPLELYRLVQTQNWEDAEFYRLLSCCECGTCSWLCPSGLPLVQNIRLGKDFLRKKP